MVDVTFQKCLMGRSDWRGARLRRVTFDSCDLTGADFSRTDRSEVTFVGCVGMS
jgi:uncharacterized protein YjbI with pentapeptide repeats